MIQRGLRAFWSLQLTSLAVLCLPQLGLLLCQCFALLCIETIQQPDSAVILPVFYGLKLFFLQATSLFQSFLLSDAAFCEQAMRGAR